MESFLFTSGEYFLATLFIAGLITGFVGSMGGSGGLLLVPFMIAAGMHPALALGTARFAAMPAWVIAIRNYNSAGQVDWKRILPLSILAIVAGSIGTFIIIDIDEKYVYPIVGTILLLLGPLTLFSQKFGTINIAKSNQSKILGYFLYFVAMLYGGFFGAGTTIITMLILVQFMGYKSLEAHGTEMTAWIAMSVISSAIFLFYDQVNFIYALIICVSMMLGSSVGSKLAIKKGDKFVKYLVAAFAILIGLKLLIWP